MAGGAGVKKGPKAEALVVDFLRERGWRGAERRVQGGGRDRGDVNIDPGLVIEVKCQRRLDLAQWLDEAEREAVNSGADVAVVWHKRMGTGDDPARWYVTMTGATFACMWRQMPREGMRDV